MDITILSGGSGNDALVKGLKKFYRNVQIKVVVNAYDNGKSTGVCREVTDTLGVSDIRKNHTRMYKALCESPDARILEFYDKRYDFHKGREAEEICTLLDSWELAEYKKYVESFFKNTKANKFDYADFSVANIVYSQMYKELGYEETNKQFTSRLGLEDFVILNSFDNVFINALTQSGKLIADEGDIVEHKDASDKIVDLIYQGKRQYGLNPKAIDAVLNTDLLVVSSGTFWSSIFPTLQYLDFYKYINKSSAKKVWVINNEEDKDAYGVTSNDFIDKVASLGLDLKDFTILENEDAVSSLRLPNPKYNVAFSSMGNNKGKHDGDLCAKALLKIYYGILNLETANMIFDFDDTIWSRSEKFAEISKQNIKIVNDYVDVLKPIIISGNEYRSIYKKISTIYGADLEGFKVDIWADANSRLYRKNVLTESLDELIIDTRVQAILKDAEQKFNIKFREVCPSNYKIKGLNELERALLTELLNLYFKRVDGSCIAKKTGTTTVDILSSKNSKLAVFEHLGFNEKSNLLYIGDEVDSGNDHDIAQKCSYVIRTSGAEETNIVLRLLLDLQI